MKTFAKHNYLDSLNFKNLTKRILFFDISFRHFFDFDISNGMDSLYPDSLDQLPDLSDLNLTASNIQAESDTLADLASSHLASQQKFGGLSTSGREFQIPDLFGTSDSKEDKENTNLVIPDLFGTKKSSDLVIPDIFGTSKDSKNSDLVIPDIFGTNKDSKSSDLVIPDIFGTNKDSKSSDLVIPDLFGTQKKTSTTDLDLSSLALPNGDGLDLMSALKPKTSEKGNGPISKAKVSTRTKADRAKERQRKIALILNSIQVIDCETANPNRLTQKSTLARVLSKCDRSRILKRKYYTHPKVSEKNSTEVQEFLFDTPSPDDIVKKAQSFSFNRK